MDYFKSKETRKLLEEDLDQLMESTESCCTFWPETSEFKIWYADILGPVGTAYEGAKWRLKIELKSDYPASTPVCKYLIPAPLHPNIGENGDICTSYLNSWDSTNGSLYNLIHHLSVMFHRDSFRLDSALNGKVRDIINSNWYGFVKMVEEQKKTLNWTV